MRACRTDKGVHAFGNVISLKVGSNIFVFFLFCFSSCQKKIKMVLEPPGMEERINSLLPKDIHLFRTRKVPALSPFFPHIFLFLFQAFSEL
jgi:tRNA pseudouridine(38-40) synthase